MLHINIKGCLKIIVTIMLKNPFNAKHPNNQTETFSKSILLLLVTDSIIAIGPEIAKRKAIKPSTKLFIEIFCMNALYYFLQFNEINFFISLFNVKFFSNVNIIFFNT